MSKSRIDTDALYGALDAVRRQRDLSMRQLAKEIGVSPSLLSRLANGYRPDADGFVTLTRFLNVPAEQFVIGNDARSSAEQPELVTQLAPLLRARNDLDADDIKYLEEVIGATVRRTQAVRSKR